MRRRIEVALTASSGLISRGPKPGCILGKSLTSVSERRGHMRLSIKTPLVYPLFLVLCLIGSSFAEKGATSGQGGGGGGGPATKWTDKNLPASGDKLIDADPEDTINKVRYIVNHSEPNKSNVLKIENYSSGILMKFSKAKPSLISILRDNKETSDVRVWATQMLCKSKDLEAVMTCTKIFADSNELERVRMACVPAMVQTIGSEEIQRTALALAQDGNNVAIKRICLGLLRKVKSPSSVSILEKTVYGGSYDEKLVATASLKDIAASDDTVVNSHAKESLEAVLQYAVTDIEASRGVKIDAMISKERQRWLSEVVHSYVNIGSGKSFGFLIRIYDASEDDRTRQDVISIAGGFKKDDQVIGLLKKALHDATPKVRMVAARSLLAATDGEAIPIIEQIVLSESNESVKNDMQRALNVYRAR
jgi:hypothetical protein